MLVIPMLRTSDAIVFIARKFLITCPTIYDAGSKTEEFYEQMNECNARHSIIGLGFSLANIILLISFTCVLPIDPIDYNLLINERAMNLTSRFTNHFRYIVAHDKFIEEISIK